MGAQPNSTVPNSSNPVYWPYITEPPAVEVLRVTIEGCAALLGVIGSILVCFLAPKADRNRRSAKNLYVVNLAVSDLFILIVNFPIAVIKEQSPLHWPIGKELCYALYPLLEMFHAACIWSIVAIAVERYRGIVRTQRQTPHSIKCTIAVIWIGSFVLFVTPLLFVVSYEQNGMGTFCYLAWPFPLMHAVYNIMDTFLLYVVPIAIITFTYLSITREINVSSLLHKRLSQSARVRRTEELQRVKQNARTKKLLTPLVVVFTITMLPVNVFRVAVICWKSFSQHKLFLVFYNVCVIGVVMNSVADPIIYSIVTKGFSARLKSFFCTKSSPVLDINTSSASVGAIRHRETDV